MTGTARRRERQIAPAVLERMLQANDKDPKVLGTWTPKQIDDAKKKIRRLKGRYYGRDAFVMADVEKDENPPPTGGHIGGICCSHAWADDCFEFKVVYPPPANRTPMQHCPGCGAEVPAQTIEGPACADCRHPREQARWGPSLSGMAIIKIRNMKMREDPTTENRGLLPDDTASLKREINRAEEGLFVPV